MSESDGLLRIATVVIHGASKDENICSGLVSN